MASRKASRRKTAVALQALDVPEGASGKPPVFIHFSHKKKGKGPDVDPRFIAACLEEIDGHYRRWAAYGAR